MTREKLLTRTVRELRAVGMKWCTRCKQAKPFGEFSADRSRGDGLMCRCRQCDLEYARVQRAKNPQASRARAERARVKNPEIYRQRARDAMTKKRAEGSIEFKAKTRHWHAARKAKIRQATPPWADTNAIKRVYEL